MEMLNTIAPLNLFEMGLTFVIVGGIIGIIFTIAHHYITKK